MSTNEEGKDWIDENTTIIRKFESVLPKGFFVSDIDRFCHDGLRIEIFRQDVFGLSQERLEEEIKEYISEKYPDRKEEIFSIYKDIITREFKMTYSQINQHKCWGFSRRSPNLNQSDYPSSFKRTSAIRESPTKRVTSQPNGDVTWLNTSICISIQRRIRLMLRLLRSRAVFMSSIISTIISYGYPSIAKIYSLER